MIMATGLLLNRRLMNRTMSVHVRDNSALAGKREPQRLSFSNLWLCPRCSIEVALTVINKVNAFRVSRDS